MTREKVAEIIDEIATDIGCEWAYHHFDEGQEPTLPFLTFSYSSSDDMFADDNNFVGIENLNIYFCSDFADFDNEDAIRTVLNKYNLAFTVQRDWIKKEHMYQTIFESEVLING